MDEQKSMLKFGAVILAAGLSKRMGEPKLLLDFHGKPLFYYSVACAIQSNFFSTVVVTGEHIQSIRELTKDLPIKLLKNPKYEEGMSTSLKLGIESMKNEVDAFLVFLADQPFLRPVLIEKLMQCYMINRSNGIRIIRPRYDGVPGHPVLFDAELSNEFLALSGDEGGRSIIKRHAQKTKFVDVADPLWGVDIDTPDDLTKYKNISPLPL
ncbi:nucleotidyltransferase family protein [Peribacillus glennii]|uniref:Nucleotidyltransferase family protein n=1 Tax=Peribacillus glennii TaxID=2303991 RepID=A0A372LFV7_9BACI|nr:nucleotidyltransferase family protein [Peribacillus glennii]RFU65137.1 nucleotidyltransferase family protein [Peribacillus glennii]